MQQLYLTITASKSFWWYTEEMENSVCVTATTRLVRLVLHCVSLGYKARDLSRELRNALWDHHTQRHLDPCAGYADN